MFADRKRERAPRRLGRDESGATALEFAIVGPLFFLVLFALIHFGWAMHCASSVRYATEQAARALALNADATPEAIRADIVSQLELLADPDVTVTVTKDRTTPGLQVADVVTQYNHKISTPFLPEYVIDFRTEVSIATPLFK